MSDGISPEPVRLMVASSVYGFESDLDQICGVLQAYGYTVLNSRLGTIPTHPNKSNLENCLDAVRQCDVFVADLKRDHFSQPRNPMLADIFYRRGLIELWGSGTQRIIRLCVEAGGPEPQFEERAGEFVVRFLAPNYAPSVPSGLDLSDRQARILAIFQSNPVRSLREIRESIDANLSDSTIRGELNRLREVGLVEAVGVGRGAFWRRIQWPDI